jgi:hypothetical protein
VGHGPARGGGGAALRREQWAALRIERARPMMIGPPVPEDEMGYPIALPAIAGLSILGAASGVWLGKSAVSEINPIYYDEAETRFHADLAPYRSPDWSKVQTAELQQASTGEDYGRFCLGCIDYPQEVYFARTREPDGLDDGWSASASYAEPEVYTASTEAVPVEQSDPEWRRVQLYAGTRVSAEPERAAPAEPADAPADEAELEPSGL